MPNENRSNAILLSIHPHYAEAILDGTKKVEFRKKNIPRAVRHVVLYATHPVMRVVGYFSVAEVVECKPSHLWKRYNGSGGISTQDFVTYYADATLSVGLVVEEARRVANLMQLKELDGNSTAPNSFRYLRHVELNAVLRRTKRITK